MTAMIYIWRFLKYSISFKEVMFLLRTSTAETLFNCTLVRVIPSVKPKVVDKYAQKVASGKFVPLNTTQASSAGSAYTSNVLSSFAGAPMAGALSWFEFTLSAYIPLCCLQRVHSQQMQRQVPSFFS